MAGITLHSARTAVDMSEVHNLAHNLLRACSNSIGVDPDFQGLEAALPGNHEPRDEFKRLPVAPEALGTGPGAQLTSAFDNIPAGQALL